MARQPRPLSAYPLQFRRLASKAVEAPNGLFPLSIPFETSTKAMDFRVQFYQYRRSLRAHMASAKEPDSSLLIEAQGAELIQSPRISPTPDAPNGQYYCTFALAAERPTMRSGLSALDDILGEAASEAHDLPAESRISKVVTVDGVTYSFGLSDLDESAQEMTAKQLAVLISNDLLELPHGKSLKDYIV